MLLRRLLPLTLVPLFALVGCQTGDVKTVLPIAGGGTIAVQLTRTGPAPGEADGYIGTTATAVPTKEKGTLQYEFGLRALNKSPDLSRIQVIDVSDDDPEPLIDDMQPKFSADGVWVEKTEIITSDDPRVKWVYTLPLAFRVYHYILTHKNGKQTTFYHVGTYPMYLKAAIRASWGQTY